MSLEITKNSLECIRTRAYERPCFLELPFEILTALETSYERLMNWIRLQHFLDKSLPAIFGYACMSKENQSRKFWLVGLPSKLLWTKIIRENTVKSIKVSLSLRLS